MSQLNDLYAEDACALWHLRHGATNAPNVRLTNLVRFDERLEAYLGALRIAGEAGWCAVTAEREAGNVGAVFVAASFAVTAGAAERFEAIEPDADHREMISALAWVDRSAAGPVLDRLANAADPRCRAIAVATWGARRSGRDLELERPLTDASPLVRASAYRTAGQLGRADLIARLPSGGDDPQCRFWSAWAAARMGAVEPLDTLADIAWNNLPHADLALDMLLRRLEVARANAWLRDFAKLPERQRSVVCATGAIGDPLYIPWLIERMAEPAIARLAGQSFSTITGVDLAYRDLDRRAPADFQSGPTDDAADENVELDADEYLPWPDPQRIARWWTANQSRFRNRNTLFPGLAKDGDGLAGRISQRIPAPAACGGT